MGSFEQGNSRELKGTQGNSTKGKKTPKTCKQIGKPDRYLEAPRAPPTSA